VTVKEYAAAHGLREDQVRKMIRSGKLKATSKPGGTVAGKIQPRSWDIEGEAENSPRPQPPQPGAAVPAQRGNTCPQCARRLAASRRQ
jgi:hypothetical protein